MGIPFSSRVILRVAGAGAPGTKAGIGFKDGVGIPKTCSAGGTEVEGFRAANSAGVKVRLAGGGFFFALCANADVPKRSIKKTSTVFFIKKQIYRFGCEVRAPRVKGR